MTVIAPSAKTKGFLATAAKSGCVEIATSSAAAVARVFVRAALTAADGAKSTPAAAAWLVASAVDVRSANRAGKGNSVKRVVKNF